MNTTRIQLIIVAVASLTLAFITFLSSPQKPPVYQVAFDTSPGEIARNIVRAHRFLRKAEPDKKHPIREPLDRGLVIADPPMRDDRWKLVMKCLTVQNGQLQLRAYTPWRREYKEEPVIKK